MAVPKTYFFAPIKTYGTTKELYSEKLQILVREYRAAVANHEEYQTLKGQVKALREDPVAHRACCTKMRALEAKIPKQLETISERVKKLGKPCGVELGTVQQFIAQVNALKARYDSTDVPLAQMKVGF
jgi:hypothetical protein